MTPKNQAKERKSGNKVMVEPQEIKAVLMEQPDFLQPVVQEAVRVGDAHSADEIGILSVGLADPASTGIAGHIHDGRQCLEQAYRAHLSPDDVSHLFNRRRIPRRRKPNRG